MKQKIKKMKTNKVQDEHPAKRIGSEDEEGTIVEEVDLLAEENEKQENKKAQENNNSNELNDEAYITEDKITDDEFTDELEEEENEQRNKGYLKNNSKQIIREKPDAKIFKTREARRIFNDVFDNATISAVHALARKKYFDEVEFVISTGKEGNVFRCTSGNRFVALKIYKIDTSDFNHMNDYIVGDERFKEVRKDRASVVKAWTRKEYRNLDELNKIGVRAPLPITFNRNCLVMEFIGKNGIAAKRVKEKPFQDFQEKYEIMCNYLAKMVEAKLVHSDLSEYNILNNDEEMVLIDVGQAVSTLHPKAKEFFERDILNLSKWFKRHGVETSYEQMYEDVKKESAKIKAKKDKE